jgi:hypothetical protein
VSSKSKTTAPGFELSLSKAGRFLAALVASLVAYVILLFVLFAVVFSVIPPPEGWEGGSTAFTFKVRLGVGFALQLLATLAVSALVARRLRAPVVVTVAATAGTIVGVWWVAVLLSS